jgi:DNA-binding beta-propeller fold protein YncE
MTLGRCSRGLLFLLAASTLAAASGHKVVKRVEVGGEGGWDYLAVDAAARRLYVSHATRVVVLDADTYAPLGEIPDTPGVHGIALAPELGRGFVSNGRGGNATIFDLATLKTLGQVKTGTNPDAILYEAVSKRVFTFNGASHDATVIDAAAGTVRATLELGGKPEFAVADGRGQIFVNLEDKAEILAIDARELKITARWPLAPCEEPTGLALDNAHRRLFAACGNQLAAVVDADNGRVLTTLPIGRGVDGMAFDPERALAFSSNGEGTLTVIQAESPDRYQVVENVATQAGARTIVLDPKTHRLFLPTAQFGPAQPATPDNPRGRPPIVPGSFVLLVVSDQ